MRSWRRRLRQPVGLKGATEVAETIAKAPLPQAQYFPQVSTAMYLILNFPYIFVPLVLDSVSHEQVSKWLYQGADRTENWTPLSSIMEASAGG